jgi:DNA-binding transcriptional MerR regulator
MASMATAKEALRIGEVAERAGVSARTLRYYEELGLLSPAGKTPGGARRYAEGDVARLLRIRELQELMGFDLEEIASILAAEDRMSDLRQEWFAQETAARKAEILAEVVEINERMQAQVRRKLDRLQSFLGDLQAKADLYAERQAELGATVQS